MSVFAISFAAYTLAIIAIGIYSARFSKNSDEDYFLAGRKLGPWVAALSASASSESGWVTLGLVGMAFRTGIGAYWILPGVLLGFIFNWFVIAGRLRHRSEALGALTIPDFFGLHFKERLPILRTLSVIIILTAMWLYVAAQFNAAGDAFSAAFAGLDYRVGVVLGAAIVLLYTVIGGFRATCWTDFAQGILMVGVLVIFPIYLLINVGGFDFIQQQLALIDANQTATETPSMLAFWPQKSGVALIGFLLGSGALGINFGFPGQPHVLVRFMALRSRKDALLGGFIAVTWAAMIICGAVTIGIIVRAITHGGMQWTTTLTDQLTDSNFHGAGDTALVLAAKNMIPGVLSGVVLAAVLAAICSTADSQLVVAGSSATNDVYARFFDRPGNKAHPIVNRLIVFALGIGAMLLVLDKSKDVYSFVLEYGWAILGASFGPQLMLVLLWKRATYAGCIAGMVTGFSVALLWKMLDPLGALADVTSTEATFPKLTETLQQFFDGVEIYNLPLAFICALTVNVIVSLVTKAKHL